MCPQSVGQLQWVLTHCGGGLTVQVRAGESKAEEQGFVLTNTVYKTSIESGLSKRGKTQVRDPFAALHIGNGDCMRQALGPQL